MKHDYWLYKYTYSQIYLTQSPHTSKGGTMISVIIFTARTTWKITQFHLIILHSLANLICQTIYSGFKVHRPLFVGSIYNIILISTHVSSSNTVIVSSNVVVSSSIVLSSVLRCCIRYRLDIISLCVESISSSNRLGPQEKKIIYKPKITYYCLDVVVTILLIVNHTGHFLYLRYKFNSMESNPGLMSSSVSSY